MKRSTLPPLRVSAELRQQAEAVLEEGETLSAMVLDAVTRNIEYRRMRQEFLSRGMASAAAARTGGGYVPAEQVLEKLGRRLDQARRQAR